MPKPQTGFPPLPKHKAEGWKYEKKKKRKKKRSRVLVTMAE